MKQVMEPQNRPQRKSPLAMKCTVNRAALKPNSGTSVYVAVDLTPSAAVIAGRVRSISLAIDSSGSMDGEKIEQAKAAALALIRQLRPTDQISIVSFSDTVTVQLPMTQVGNSREVAAAVKAISVSGLTAMYDGLDSAFNQARRASQEPGTVNRVLLLTDGNPTVGKTIGSEFVTLAQRIRESGITITAIGIGTDYNEQLLEKIAESGGGLWHHIVDARANLPQIFQDQAAQMAGTVVSNPELKVSIMPGSELADAYTVKPVLNRLPRPRFDGAAFTVPLRDLIAGEEQTLVFRIGVPARPPAQRGGQEGLPASDDDHRKEETEAVMNVTKCSACDSENREDARFCDACGAKIEPEAKTSELKLVAMPAEEEASVAPTNEDAGTIDSMFGPDAGEPETAGELEPPARSEERRVGKECRS